MQLANVALQFMALIDVASVHEMYQSLMSACHRVSGS